MASLLRKGNRTAPAEPPAPTRAPPTRAPPKAAATGGGTGGGTGAKRGSSGDFTPWDLAQIWIESVGKEESGRKQWEQMYSWMADYDPKGNIKPPKPPLENATRFSNTVPNSRGHDYGWRLGSNAGHEIQNLQARFDDQHRKRVPKEVLGYD